MNHKSRREFLGDSLLAAAAAASVPLVAPSARARSSQKTKDPIRVGIIGVRGRGRDHLREFINSPDSTVVALCDADSGVVEPAMRHAEGATYYQDLRKMLEEAELDAVSVATPNHWHSLATIWALQAGKHVYVEKPISQNVVEGRRVVQFAAATGLVVQHGTQARSQPACRDAIAWMKEGHLGKVKLARGLCYKRRNSIGKVDGEQQPPATCNYDLWTGPAALQPLMRKNLHYDWHWDFNTGNGDIGNQGVHQMDLARWGLGLDTNPHSVASVGARLGYVDDANTPNTQVAVYEYDDAEIVFEVRGLPTPPYMGKGIGTIFHCEGGYLVIGSYSSVTAYDLDGKEVKTFKGSTSHVQNFLDAIKVGDPQKVNAPPIEGHLSSALCHLGNISYRLGEPTGLGKTDTPFANDWAGNEAFQRFRQHLADNDLPVAETEILRGPRLAFDPRTERFQGAEADRANPLATRPPRPPFSLPST